MKEYTVPIFDKSVNYIALMIQENARMSVLKQRLELESTNYFTTLKQVLKSQINLKREIKLNEYNLRKRDQKQEEFVRDKIIKSSRSML
jgi:predicted Holliday junction resolvase-like endonuclease